MSAISDRDINNDTAELLSNMVDGYHVLAHHGIGLGLLAHFTVRAVGGDSFWTYQLGQSFEEVSVESFREVDFDMNVLGPGGNINPTLRIHALTYQARPDIQCVIHHHGMDSVAMGAIGAVLAPIDRNAAKFHDDLDIIADYDNAHRIAEQGDAIVNCLQDKRALILKHHGVLVTGHGIADAVVATLMLEHCFAVQLKAMAAGELQVMPAEEIEDAKEFLNSDLFVGGTWDYLKRAKNRAFAA